MPSKPLFGGDDSYKAASEQLDAAINSYRANPNVQNLVAVYEAQNAVRAAANNAGSNLVGGKTLDPKKVQATVAGLKDPMNEPVPGAGLGLAQALLDQLRVQQSQVAGPKSIEQTRALGEAQRQLEEYIQSATARVQDDDTGFADEYMRLTGQAPPPGRFSSAQTINGTTPTPQPGASPPESGITGAPDAGVRPEFGPPDPGVRPVMSLAAGSKAPKRVRAERADNNVGKENNDPSVGAINIEPLPAYAPFDAAQEYRASGLDVAPGTQGANDSVQTADKVMAQSPIRQTEHGILQSGAWYGENKGALKSGRLVFTGYQTRNTKYIDETNPRFGSQITTTKTPTYQSTAGLTYALGKTGFPSIAAYQKAMGLPVTGTLDDPTMNAWQGTINQAAMNTASGQNTTIQMAMADQIKRAQILASQQRAAMAAAYNVDPTASAAVLGAAMKQITGRVSTAGEDSEFHRAFNSANISTQGKVDAQQFARDWVRNKYPTEAGTQAGQDYYGAMYDVLTSGPGSLGSEAANING